MSQYGLILAHSAVGGSGGKFMAVNFWCGGSGDGTGYGRGNALLEQFPFEY